MKRSMTNEAFGKEVNRSESFNEESRKFKRQDLSCNVFKPGRMEFTVNQSDQTQQRFLKTKFEENVASRQSKENNTETCTSATHSAVAVKPDVDAACETSDPVELNFSVLKFLPCHEHECDVTLITDSGPFMANKALLIDSSDYFRAMFTLNMAEKDKTVVYMKDFDGMYLWRFLNFVGFGHTPLNGCNDALEFLRFAVYLQCPKLITTCAKYLTSNLDPENACLIVSTARDLALSELVKNVLDYIFQNFTKLDRVDSKVGLLPADDLLKLLQSDGLGGKSNSSCEISVLKIVLRWLLRNGAAKKSVQEAIVSNVRFALIKPDCITSACQDVMMEVSKEIDLSNDSVAGVGSVFYKHLNNAMAYHKDLYKQPLVQSETTSLRTSNRSWASIDGVLAPCTIKLSSNSEWKMNKPPTHIRDPFHTVVELNGFLFILGGTREIDGGFSNVVIRYDPRVNSYIQLSSMNERRGDFVAFPHEDRIFVFGGRNKSGGLKSCECYHLSSNSWHYVADLPESLFMAAGVGKKGKMYLSGGFKENIASADTFCYDPKTDSWEKLFSRMIKPRGYHAMIEGSDGHLWAVGGIDNNLTGRNIWDVEALDLDRNVWNLVGYVLPRPLVLCTLRLNILRKENGNICIFAVSSPDKYSMLEYDDKHHSWMEMSSPIPLVGLRLPTNFKVRK